MSAELVKEMSINLCLNQSNHPLDMFESLDEMQRDIHIQVLDPITTLER
jgi:hypothetical protein